MFAQLFRPLMKAALENVQNSFIFTEEYDSLTWALENSGDTGV